MYKQLLNIFSTPIYDIIKFKLIEDCNKRSNHEKFLL